MTRLVCLLFAAVLAVPAAAQAPDPPEPSPEALEYERLGENARDFHVITVLRQGSGYVYDVDGWDEDEIVLWFDGSLILRAPGVGRVMFVVDTPNPQRAPSRQNAETLTPDQPVGRLVLSSGDALTGRRVRALVCTAPGAGDACTTWTEARPLSGGDGLVVKTLFSLPVYGGDRNKARDDG